MAFIELRHVEGARHTLAKEGTEVTLSFDGNAFTGTAGCNDYAGLGKVEDKSITIDVGSLSVTAMACENPEGLMEQEQRFVGNCSELMRSEKLAASDQWVESLCMPGAEQRGKGHHAFCATC